jgi:hypothetical protein
MQVLLELIEIQETAVEVMQKWQPIIEQHTQQQPQHSQQQQQQQQQSVQSRLSALRAASSTADINSSGSSSSGHVVRTLDIQRLLQQATPEEVLFVLTSTPQDWREFFKGIVVRHMGLLDLVQKPWLGDSLPPAAAAAAAAADKPLAAAAAGDLPACAAASQPAHPTPAAAAAAASEGPVDSAGQPLLPAPVIWREIEADVGQWLKISSIGFLINTTTLIAAGSTHFVSVLAFTRAAYVTA